MAEHYNAFISYRHKPRDIEVAQEIQKQLERFHIPRDLRKKYGIERIERIFRDKEELPTTSNLTDDIETALGNSDYLIVICTPATRESRWITREINLFLEHHDQSRVMTVLAEGEPGDVIPERLLMRKKKVIGSDGKEVEITEEIEPLSCDYRMDFRKARKIELPRLLSVIIGCSYDELMRRRQQYMMRRIGIISAIVSSALAVFIGYLIWSRQQIRENYLQAEENLRQSRINQSKFLSSSALDALEDNDRILAIQLALEAMPKENDPRPLTAEAEYALSTSLGIYTIGGTLDYTAVRQYETDALIRQMIVSKEGTAMAAIDADYRLYLWNLVTHELILDLPCNGSADIYDADDRGFLLVSDGHISMFSWADGSELFSLDQDLSSSRFIFDKERGFASCYGSKNCYWTDLEGKIHDPVDLSSIAIPEGFTATNGRFYPEKHLLIVTADDITNFMESAQKAILYDYEAESSAVLSGQFHHLEETFLLKSGDLLFADFENSFSETTTSFLNGTTFYDMTVILTCISPDTRQEKWSIPLHYTQAGSRRYKLLSNKEGKEYLLVSLSNLQFLIDTETGEIHHRSEWPYDVVEIITADDSMTLSILNDGSFAVGYPEKDSPDTMMTHLISDISMVKRAWPVKNNASFMVVPTRGSRVIQFDSKLTSPAYSTLFPLDQMRLFYSSFEDDSLALCGKKNEESLIRLYDLAKDEQIMELPVEDTSFTYFGFLPENRFCYIFANNEKNTGKMTDLSTGKTTDILLPTEDESLSELKKAFKKNTLFYAGKFYDADHFLIGSLNLADNTARSFEPRREDEMFLKEIFPLEDQNHVLITYTAASFSSEVNILLADLEAKTCIKLKETFPDGYINPASDETRFAIRAADGVKVFDYSGVPLLTLPLNISTIPSFTFHEGDLFVLSGDGIISRYDPEGTLKAMYEGEIIPEGMERDSFLWNFSGDTLTIFFNGSCEQFDLSERRCRMAANKVLALDEKRNRILVQKTDSTIEENEVGAFRLFTPEELTAEAERTVGNITISDETKNRYGLN